MNSLSKIYTEAAEKISDGSSQYSCIAIASLVYSKRHMSIDVIPEVSKYVEVFNEGIYNTFVLNVSEYGNLLWIEGAREHRIIMLLMMAACWKDFE